METNSLSKLPPQLGLANPKITIETKHSASLHLWGGKQFFQEDEEKHGRDLGQEDEALHGLQGPTGTSFISAQCLEFLFFQVTGFCHLIHISNKAIS